MTRTTPCLGLVLCALTAGSARPQETTPPKEAPATFPTQLEQVTVDVVVTDGKGKPIPDLKQGDLQIFEDGVPQGIVSFEAFQVPAPAAAEKPVPRPRVSTNTGKEEARNGRTFVILFDDIHSTALTARRAKVAITDFLSKSTREGDRVTVAASAGGAWWSARMEAGRPALVDLVKHLEGRYVPDTGRDRLTEYEAMRIHVFRDPAVMNRVERRFDSSGMATMRRPGQGQNHESFRATEDPLITGRAAEVYYAALARNRTTLRALERSLNALVGQRGRKSLILVSEGFIYDPGLLEFKGIIEASRRANTAIYFLNTRGLEALPLSMEADISTPLAPEDMGSAFSQAEEDAEGSESLAADSGGFAVRNTNDLAGGLERIGDETRTYYLVGYNPKNTKRDGAYRKIQVKVSGLKGARVRARKGYYAPSDSKPTVASKPAVDTVFQKALDAPYAVSDIPLRMTHFVREETLVGKVKVMLATEVDVRGLGFEEKGGQRVGSVQFLLVASQRETGEHFRYDQTVDLALVPATYERMARTGLPIARDFELGPGSYQAKIVVRDKATERVGTVVHDFEVPDPSEFRVSTPILSDVRESSPEGGGGEGLAILARRDFPSQGTLYCQFEVYGATKEAESHLPKVSMGYEVRGSDGTLYTRDPPSRITPPPQGTLSRLLGFSLEAATPGDYELVMKFKDDYSGKSLELREPFTVSAPGSP